MYLADLTRNSFQSGISATKWLGLCKLLISKMPTVQLEGMGQVASSISNSVLVLYRSYPGDPGLQDYLKAAIQDGILPISTFVSTFLSAARSPDLHLPATLDTLCHIALDAHYSSGQPSLGSIVAFNESPTVTLNTIQDALALLRVAYSIPPSHFHQLTTSVSELVTLLLSCVPDLSQMSTAQALVHFADANHVLTNYRLTPDVRQMLDAFVISLSLLIGDDVKAATEAQMMHTMQLALNSSSSKGSGGEILGGPSSDTDVITFGLLLNHLVTYRARDFGAGDDKHAVALLVGCFRWSSWTPTVFLTQLLVSAFTCISQPGNNPRLWKAFVVGRLPSLLSSFATLINGDSSTKIDLTGALYAALEIVSRRTDIIISSDQVLSREGASDSNTEDESARFFLREFLQQLVKSNLLNQQLASQLDPMVSNESIPKWHVEAHDMGLDISAYIESKILQDSSSDAEIQAWVDRVWRDASSHQIFASLVYKRFSTLTTSLDVDSLGQLCKVLHTCESALDMVSLHEPIADLLFYALICLEDYDCETVGDPQTAVTHLGDVVLFVQYTMTRFKFEDKELTRNNRTVSPGYLLNTDIMPKSMDRIKAELANAWTKAIFVNSEGIEDNILRSTNPKILVRIAPAIIIQAIQYSSLQKIDKEALMNGVSYFTGPLLNWTLVGVIKALVKDVQQKQFAAPMHHDIIQSLILSPSCPKSVLALCSPQILALISDKKRPTPPNAFNVSNIRQILAEAIGCKGGGDSLPTNFPAGQIPYQQVQQAIQRAFGMARSHKPPFLDVRRCLKTLSSIRFVQLLWMELNAVANLGELEACRRVATFVLGVPQDSSTPPLLPIFMHLVLPALIASADNQQPPEQTINVELLVVIISSTLNAAVHLEWAMRSIPESGDGRPVLGQSSAAMARRVALDLRRNRASQVSGMVYQRLSSSASFVANFPAFISDLGT